MSLPAGRLSDGLSRTTVLVGGLGGIVVGFGLLSTVASYAHLLLGAAVVGASSAFYFTPSRAFLSDLFVERRGQAMGIQSTAGLAGSALAAGVAIVALRYATWQAAFLPSMAVLGVVGLLLHRWSHEPYVLRGASIDFDLVGTGRRLLGEPHLRRLVGMRTLVAFTIQSFGGFLPAFLQFEKGFSPEVAGAGFATFFVVGAAVTPLRVGSPTASRGSAWSSAGSPSP